MAEPPMFQAFLDESGKFEDKKVVSVCGLCSPPRRVQEFGDEWKGLLRSYDLPSLTMKRALRRKIKFCSRIEARSVEERNEVLKPFARCIRKHFELGISISVDVPAYRALPTSIKRAYGGGEDPFYFAFLTALVACEKHLRPMDRVNLVFDDDAKTAINCYKLYRRVRYLRAEIKKKFVAITFADDKELVPLQGADFLSSISRLEAGRGFHREYYEYVPLFSLLSEHDAATPIMWAYKFYDRESPSQLKPVR